MSYENEDPELGTTGFMVPSSPEKDGSGERLADKSGSTDQSSLDPEQPTKPLIFEKYMINGNQDQKSKQEEFYPEKTNSSVKRKKRKSRGMKERVFCIIGLFTLLAGLILMAVALFLIKDNVCSDSSENSDNKIPSSGEYKQTENVYGITSHTQSSRNVVPPKVTTSQSTTSTTTTVGTTTYFSFEHLVNIAEGKEAFQSSTHRSEEGLVLTASAAVDGSPENSIYSGHCSQTNSLRNPTGLMTDHIISSYSSYHHSIYEEENPVWWVDLKRFKLVKHIRITQPSDCCSGSLSNFEIRVGQQTDLTMNVLCRYYMGAALNNVVDIQCERQIYGRYVSIQLLQEETKDKRRLTLCEVAIYER